MMQTDTKYEWEVFSNDHSARFYYTYANAKRYYDEIIYELTAGGVLSETQAIYEYDVVIQKIKKD